MLDEGSRSNWNTTRRRSHRLGDSMKDRPWSLRTARPSFLDGIASLFDLGGTLSYPYYAPAFETDAMAFAHDGKVLSADFDRAFAVKLHRVSLSTRALVQLLRYLRFRRR